MNQLFLVIEKEFDIIDESKDERGEFDMSIGVGTRHNLTSRHGLNDGLQTEFRFRGRVCVRQRLNEMRGVVALGGNTIGGVGAGRQPSLSYSKWLAQRPAYLTKGQGVRSEKDSKVPNISRVIGVLGIQSLIDELSSDKSQPE